MVGIYLTCFTILLLQAFFFLKLGEMNEDKFGEQGGDIITLFL